MKSEVKNYGHSIRSRLLNSAKATQQPFMKVLPRYFQERILFRLSLSRYKDNFLLKGGALLYAHYNYQARPTVDIDFLGTHVSHDLDVIKGIFAEILSIKCLEDGVSFDIDTLEANEITLEKEYNGVRLEFVAHLDTIVMLMSMDIGFGDVVTPQPQLLEYPIMLPNLPEVEILAYSLETVVAEKFEAMVALGEHNSRMKDFFDVYRILNDSNFSEEDMSLAIKNTFDNRKTVVVDNHPVFTKGFYEEKRRSALWNGFLKKIKWNGQIDFLVVGEEIHRRLYPIYNHILSENKRREHSV